MKRQGVHAWLVLLCLAALLTACAPASPVPPTSTAAPSHTPAPSLTVTPSPTAVPSATPSPSPTACAQAHGALSTQVLASQSMHEEYSYAIYLPPCYPASAPAGGYPVLYLLHGQGMDESTWTDLGLPETLDRLIASGEIAPLLVVMPREKRELQSPAESKYAGVLLGELIPAVEGGYAACAQRDCRLLGGISRGAAWAVHIGLQNPGLFSAVGGHSLTPFYGDTRDAPGWIKAMKADETPRLWLDMGDKDRFRQGYDGFVSMLQGTGLAFSEHTSPGKHDAAYWSAHLEDYLRWYGGN